MDGSISRRSTAASGASLPSRRAPVYRRARATCIDAVGDRLVARPFDPEKGELAGEPLRLEERPPPTSTPRTARPRSRRRAPSLVAAVAIRADELVWLDRRGRPLGEIPLPERSFAIRALARRRPRRPGRRGSGPQSEVDLWVVDLASERRQPAHFAAGVRDLPVWSPDGATPRLPDAIARGSTISGVRPSIAGGDEHVLYASPTDLERGPQLGRRHARLLTDASATTGFDILADASGAAGRARVRVARLRRPASSTPRSRPTTAGSHTPRTSPVAPRSTSAAPATRTTKYQVTTEGGRRRVWTRGRARALLPRPPTNSVAVVPVDPASALAFGHSGHALPAAARQLGPSSTSALRRRRRRRADHAARARGERQRDRSPCVTDWLPSSSRPLRTMIGAPMIGSRLGPYEITAKLGEGGMGEVYRATDTRLEREVAIKVLPAAFTADPERLARFEREAKLLAQLHHPNIASIYGLEDSSGARALVMELVDGPTLAERLAARAACRSPRALSIALQIAEALEEAHEQGHRPPRSQAPERQGCRSTARSRCSTSAWPRRWIRPARLVGGRSRALADADELADADRGARHAARRDPRHGGLHGARAGARRRGRQARRHLGVRRRAVRDAHRRARCSPATRSPTRSPGAQDRDRPRSRCPPATPPRDPPARCAAASSAIRRTACTTSPTRGSCSRRCCPAARGATRAARRRGAPAPRGASGRWPGRCVARARGAGASRLAAAAPRRRSADVTLGAGDSRTGYVLSSARASAARALARRPPAGGRRRRRERQPRSSSCARSDEFEPTRPARDRRRQHAVLLARRHLDRLLPRRRAVQDPGRRRPSGPSGGRRQRASRAAAPGARDGFIYFTPDTLGGLSRVPENGGAVEAGDRARRARATSARTAGREALPGRQRRALHLRHAGVDRVLRRRPDRGGATGDRRAQGAGRGLEPGALRAGRPPRLRARRLALRGRRSTRDARPSGRARRQVAQGVSTDVGSGAVQFAIAAERRRPLGARRARRLVPARLGRSQRGRVAGRRFRRRPTTKRRLSPDGTRVALVGGQGGVADLWVADLERGTLTRLTVGEFTASPVWTPDGTRIAYAVRSPGAGGAPRPRRLEAGRRQSRRRDCWSEGLAALPERLHVGRPHVWSTTRSTEREPRPISGSCRSSASAALAP